MSGDVYSFSVRNGVFRSAGSADDDLGGLILVETEMNSDKRKFKIPLWGDRIFIGKRTKIQNKISVPRIAFLVAQLVLTRDKEGKVKLTIAEDFMTFSEYAFKYLVSGTK
jgi:hypothetical protein